MLNRLIQIVLLGLLIFTPLAGGSVDLWAFSVMEVGTLLIIVLWSIQRLINTPSPKHSPTTPHPSFRNSQLLFPTLLLALFLCLVFLQMVHLSPQIISILSPKTYSLRNQLLVAGDPLQAATLSFYPMATKVEFFKWMALGGFFLFLLRWELLGGDRRRTHSLIVVIILMGSFESLYGMFSYVSRAGEVSPGVGTFINRNHLAGYLLMVIPLGIGFLFSREADQVNPFSGWRHRLSSLDGKSLIIAFAVIVMILALILSASRMAILSLLVSFSLIMILVRSLRDKHRFSKKSALILGLGVLWAVWLGVDAVISRFFTLTEDFESRRRVWANTIQIIGDFPLFGSGLGTFTQVFPMHRSFHIRGLVTHAENDFLQLVSEVGWVGFGLLFTLFLSLFIRMASGIRSSSEREPERYIAIGGLVGMVALMLHSLVEKNIQVPANALLYTTLWALVLKISTKLKQKVQII